MGGRNIDPDMMDLARHGETRPCLRRPARGRRLATVRGTPSVRDGPFPASGFTPGSGTVSRPATRTPRPGRPSPLGHPLYTAPARDKVGPLEPDIDAPTGQNFLNAEANVFRRSVPFWTPAGRR